MSFNRREIFVKIYMLEMEVNMVSIVSKMRAYSIVQFNELNIITKKIFLFIQMYLLFINNFHIFIIVEI